MKNCLNKRKRGSTAMQEGDEMKGKKSWIDLLDEKEKGYLKWLLIKNDRFKFKPADEKVVSEV